MIITETVINDWAGSGVKFDTVHGKVIWETNDNSLPLVHCEFDLTVDGAEDEARIKVSKEFTKLLESIIHVGS